MKRRQNPAEEQMPAELREFEASRWPEDPGDPDDFGGCNEAQAAWWAVVFAWRRYESARRAWFREHTGRVPLSEWHRFPPGFPPGPPDDDVA
jgi:hypothetical protein